MNVVELTLAAALGVVATVGGTMFWQGEVEDERVRADLLTAADLAADFRRGHRCWIAAGRTDAAAMMAALGRQVPLRDPAAWAASFGPQWMAVHYTSADADRRAALTFEGAYERGTTVTVEFPDADPLRAGRRMMMSVREGAAVTPAGVHGLVEQGGPTTC